MINYFWGRHANMQGQEDWNEKYPNYLSKGIGCWRYNSFQHCISIALLERKKGPTDCFSFPCSVRKSHINWSQRISRHHVRLNFLSSSFLLQTFLILLWTKYLIFVFGQFFEKLHFTNTHVYKDLYWFIGRASL